MTLTPNGERSTLVVQGEAAVPIPLFGSKIEAVIAEQIGQLLGQRGELHPRASGHRLTVATPAPEQYRSPVHGMAA